MDASSIEDDIHEIQTDEGRKFQLKVQASQQFYGRFSGAQDFNGRVAGVSTQDNFRKWFQEKFNISILVPKMGPADTSIIIQGTNKRDVLRAKNRIDVMVNGQPVSTHFLSISCSTEEINRNFQAFKKHLRRVSEACGLNFSKLKFVNSKRLHFAILMLVLTDNQDTAIAMECLEECKKMIVSKFLQDGPLQVTLTGLSCMDDNPKFCKVLYAKVVSEKMQEVAKYFESRGMIRLEEDNVKLHVSLLKAKPGYAENKAKNEAGSSNHMDSNEKGTFDATKTIEIFRDYYFGSFIVNEIYLTKLFADKAPKTKHYEKTGVIHFKNQFEC